MKLVELHSEIQFSILEYFSNHPNASGSVETINFSWLTNERFPHNVDQVQTALDRLVDHGEINMSSDNNYFL